MDEWILTPAIDARAAGLAQADLIFIFGTRLDAPAIAAADLFNRGLAPLVVVTGGTTRQADGLNEARHHLELLTAHGVPSDSVIVEDRSANTTENVLFALPLVRARCGDPETVIAVVKRNHRRALVTLAHHAPSIQRIYSVDYQQEIIKDGRNAREAVYMRDLVAEGIDPLVGDGNGWCRSHSSSA